MKHAERPLCRCGMRPVAVNYYKKDIAHYRTQCDKCIRQDKKLETTSHTEWKASGYIKKTQCERCGFKSQHHIQLDVYHQDGNRKNNNFLAKKMKKKNFEIFPTSFFSENFQIHSV